jgi:hypothetical protein
VHGDNHTHPPFARWGSNNADLEGRGCKKAQKAPRGGGRAPKTSPSTHARTHRGPRLIPLTGGVATDTGPASQLPTLPERPGCAACVWAGVAPAAWAPGYGERGEDCGAAAWTRLRAAGRDVFPCRGCWGSLVLSFFFLLLPLVFFFD